MAVEYGLILALVAVAAIGGLRVLGAGVDGALSAEADRLAGDALPVFSGGSGNSDTGGAGTGDSGGAGDATGGDTGGSESGTGGDTGGSGSGTGGDTGGTGDSGDEGGTTNGDGDDGSNANDGGTAVGDGSTTGSGDGSGSSSEEPPAIGFVPDDVSFAPAIVTSGRGNRWTAQQTVFVEADNGTALHYRWDYDATQNNSAGSDAGTCIIVGNQCTWQHEFETPGRHDATVAFSVTGVADDNFVPPKQAETIESP